MPEEKHVEAYFEGLEKLSTEELDREAQECVLSEQKCVASLIAHLSEISKRKAHLELGYKDLFDYCVRRLKLSEGSVYLRLQVAGVARRFPEVLSRLAENRISLTVAGMLAPHLREDNFERLLSDCEGKSRREAEEYLVTLKPRPLLEPGIRKKPEIQSSDKRGGAEEREGSANVGVSGSHSPGDRTEARIFPLSSSAPINGRSSGLIQPAQPEIYNFRFSANKAFKEKLLRVAEVLGIPAPEKNLAKVIERALDLTLERKDPQKKLERRRERERDPAERSSLPRPDKALAKRSGGKEWKETTGRLEGARARTRAIPTRVRERVLEKGGYQCEYQGPHGTRCTQRVGLEVDHLQAFAKRGPSDEGNLQVLCKAHNLFRAVVEFGGEFIRHKIAQRRENPQDL